MDNLMNRGLERAAAPEDGSSGPPDSTVRRNVSMAAGDRCFPLTPRRGPRPCGLKPALRCSEFNAQQVIRFHWKYLTCPRRRELARSERIENRRDFPKLIDDATTPNRIPINDHFIMNTHPTTAFACVVLFFLSHTAQAAETALGPLRVHPDNPRYFTDGTKRKDGTLNAVYLTGAHTWNNLVDMGRHDPPEPFDFGAYLNFLERHHHNFIRLWAWDSTWWDTRANGWLGKDFVHHAWPQPWLRTGSGEALDGKPRFDLTRFNSAYFERLRSRVADAGERGIYVSIMLFEGWGLMHGNRRRNLREDGWAWRSHPFNPSNNINGVDLVGAGALNGRVHVLGNPKASELQGAYIRRVVDTVNDLDNVLYEVINEGGEKEWDWWVANTIRDHERTKPKQHPIGITGHGAERIDSMLASPADWISPGRNDGYAENPPAWDGRKVSLLDTDHIWGVGGNVAWVWKSFARGHNPIFMDPYDGSVLGEDRGWEPIRAALGHTRLLAERLDLSSMKPHDELASTGYCLAAPGSAYVVVQPSSGDGFTVDLQAGSYRYEWLNAANGEVAEKGRIDVESGAEFRAPFDGVAVLYLSVR